MAPRLELVDNGNGLLSDGLWIGQPEVVICMAWVGTVE